MNQYVILFYETVILGRYSCYFRCFTCSGGSKSWIHTWTSQLGRAQEARASPSSKQSVTAKDPLIPLIRSVFSRPLCGITHNLVPVQTTVLHHLHYSQWMVRWISHLVVFYFCSRSSKSANNKIYTFLELECLIKLLYPIRSNINNTNVLLLAHFVDKKTQNNAFTKKKTERERAKGDC